MNEGVGVLLGHEFEFVLQCRVVVASNQSDMGKRTNFLGALTATLFVALQKVAELLIVLAFLLLNRHDVLECLAEILKVQVQVLLIVSELGDLLSKNRDISVSKRLFAENSN